jgi:ABC-type transport system involved in multi-copper enzyme maturation permease subunit
LPSIFFFCFFSFFVSVSVNPTQPNPTMVLSNASRAARHQQAIINRTNVCGGPKKAGITPRIGWFMSSNPSMIGAPQRLPLFCVPNKTVQTQRVGYRATIGGNMG